DGGLVWAPPLEVVGAEVAQGGVAAARVVEALDVIEDGHPRLRVGAPAGPVDQLALQRGEEALGQGVVERVADRAHRRGDARPSAPLPEGQTRILTASVRVMNEPGGRSPAPKRRLQGVHD